MRMLDDDDFELFSHCFGEGCLVVGCYFKTENKLTRIPDFKVEDGKVLRLSKIEVEAEQILIRKNKEEQQ